MFRQIKSAIIWAYIYRFRILLFKILIAFVIALIIEYVYRDIIEFLQVSKQIEFLLYILVVKWLLLLAIVLYLFFSIYQVFKKQKDEHTMKHNKKKEILHKKQLPLTAEQIIQQKLKQRKR